MPTTPKVRERRIGIATAPLRSILTITIVSTLAVGCRSPEPTMRSSTTTISATPLDATPRDCRPDPAVRGSLRFERSPGGVPEVSPGWVRAHHCDVRVIDVREPDELAGPLGRLAFADYVPADRLLDEASAWDTDEPIVLLCRSGRRSARAARALEDLGFSRVASMTGGMLAWHDRHYPVEHAPAPRRPRASVTEANRDAPVDADAIAAHLGDPRRIRWVKLAALLLSGTQSCVDGRDTRPVVGTPGGDAGELLLALASAERIRPTPYTSAEVAAILDAYLEAFGRFYMHTDAHALAVLGEHLRGDPRFAARLATGDPDAVERLLRRPPRELEPALLELVRRPEHVGCGHLRLILSHPEEYGARRELAEALMAAIFERLWRGEPMDFVVLEGEHHETAIVNVVLDGPMHAFSRIPTVAPHVGERELFVNHPQVSRWLREQNASFLFEVDPWLHEHPERQRAFLRTLEGLGDAQLAATLRHLAPRLPIFEAHVREDGVRVERVGGSR